jgi:hypothetical protein
MRKNGKIGQTAQFFFLQLSQKSAKPNLKNRAKMLGLKTAVQN